MGGPVPKVNDVMKESWDYLIVLDACRYDYFKREYERFFNGELENRISLGSATAEWCRKQFKGYFADVIYVSGNPYINSKKAIAGFDARKHFFKVIDVWDFGWNKELLTVPPEEVNAATLKSIDKFPKKRRIIHYLQPHVPYISPKFKNNFKGAPIITGWRNQARNSNLGESKVKTYLKNLANTILRILKHHIHVLFIKIGLNRQYELQKLFGLPPARPMEATWRQYGVKGVREAYKENLKIVLEYATILCMEILQQKPSAQIVVTADHGDFLGDKGNFDHYPGSKDLILLEVPWLKVKSVKNSGITQVHKSYAKHVKGSYKKRLKEKIKRMKKAGKFQ